MKKIQRFFLWFLWIFLWAGVSCRLYYENLDQLPKYPMAFWVALKNFFGVNNSESLETMEAFTMLVTMFVLVSILHAIAFFVWRKIKRQKSIT